MTTFNSPPPSSPTGTRDSLWSTVAEKALTLMAAAPSVDAASAKALLTKHGVL